MTYDMDNINVTPVVGSAGPATPPPTAKNLEKNQANFKQKYFVYTENKLIQFCDDDDTHERGVLQIKYARLKKTHIKDNKTKLYGFILMAKGLYLQFFHTQKEEIDKWIEALKQSCILLDLKDEFMLGSLLGKGNFAKVHSCERKNDPDKVKYALKTIEKSGIKQCKRNITSVLLEIDILRDLDHEFVIKLHEVYESTKYIHLVLSYLDGGELFERIRSKKAYQEKQAI
jgi:serine/threonine protein kinase